MILGIGSDIIQINRISKTINKFGDRFKNRCFTKIEIAKSEKRLNSVASYAKRYAAKEACSKALGTGLAKGVNWTDIGVENNLDGKPIIILKNKALDRLNKICPKDKKAIIDVTITDEKNLAYAMVIISTK